MAIMISVVGQTITVTSDADLVQNSVNVYECSLSLDSAWSGLSPTVVFWNKYRPRPIEVVPLDNACVVPHDVLKDPGELRIGIYGTSEDTVYPTIWSEPIAILPGTSTDGIGVTEIDESLYAILRELIDELAYQMRVVTETVTGTDVEIIAQQNHRYICGEVETISITPSSSGICDVIFTSGSTPAVLTVPDTVIWANGFDPTSLDSDAIYEVNIADGIYGVATSWT